MATSTPAKNHTMSTLDTDEAHGVTTCHPNLEKNDQNCSTMSGKDGAQATGPPTESDTPEPTAAPSPRQVHGLKWTLVCVSLYLSALIYGLDTTIAADVQSAVVETFGSVDQLTWIGTGYPLGAVALILPMGAFYVTFDMKWTYIASFIIFEAGSALCGAAPTMNALIVGRVLAGVGGCGVYMGALNYFSVCTSHTERGGYIAGIGFVWGAGSILGPVIGGALSVSSATWRWAFYMNLVIGAACVPIYLLYLPSIQPQPDIAISTKLSNIDWTGAMLSTGFVSLFTIVLTFAGISWRWKDASTIVTWIIFGLLLLLFIIQQRFAIFTSAKNRLFPCHLLRSPTQIFLYIGTSVAATCLFIPVYYIPIYFQFVKKDTALMAAVRLLPFMIIGITVVMVSGIMLARLTYYSPLYLIAGVLIILGGSLMLTTMATTAPGAIYGYSIPIAIGAGLIIQSGYSIATIRVSSNSSSRTNTESTSSDISSAVSFQNVAQVGSTLIALVLSGQIFQSVAFLRLKAVLAGLGYSDVQIRSAVAGTQSQIFEELDRALLERAVEAITGAVARVWALVVAAGVVGLVVVAVGLGWVEWREKVRGRKDVGEISRDGAEDGKLE